MTVNRSSLVELLVQKTGLERDQVEEQLNLLIEKVKKEIEEGNDYQAGGLGTFSLEDGDIVFQPEENLATEINYKYAGMKPIELIGAFKEVPGEEVSRQEPEISPISDVEQYSEELASEEEVPAEELSASVDHVEENTGGIAEEEPVEHKEEVPDIPEPAADESTEEVEKESEKKAEPVLSKPEPEAEAESTQKKYRPKKKEEKADPIGKILVAAVIVMAIGVSGWMFYDLGYFGNGTTNSTENTTQESSAAQNMNVIEEEPANSEDNKSGGDSVSTGSVAGGNESSEQNEPNSISNVSSIAEESRQSIYGLRGGASPRVEDGYTIVVHSLRDEAKVRSLNEQLQQEGYRTVISKASIMDTTFWRLGLGQFKTIKDATEASQLLPDPYRSNHFIKRIQ